MEKLIIKKKLACENKNSQFWVLITHTQNFSKLTGNFWLKFISTSCYKHCIGHAI